MDFVPQPNLQLIPLIFCISLLLDSIETIINCQLSTVNCQLSTLPLPAQNRSNNHGDGGASNQE
ncbi:MAG: hypothetical protein HC942_20270 [Microcoleus sp. SU_5_6]|nr:hypothetical protein [Microcoleus sp. SU_5_6]